MITVIAALVSVILRASTSVIDRNSFGLKSQPIIFLNFINNILPGLLLSIVLVVIDHSYFFELLFNPKLIIFGFSVQVVAFAFSYGVKHLTVAKVNLANRIGDIAVPLALFLAGATVTKQDFIFSFIISTSVLFLSWKSDKKQNLKVLLLPALFIPGPLFYKVWSANSFFQKTYLLEPIVLPLPALLHLSGEVFFAFLF